MGAWRKTVVDGPLVIQWHERQIPVLRALSQTTRRASHESIGWERYAGLPAGDLHITGPDHSGDIDLGPVLLEPVRSQLLIGCSFCFCFSIYSCLTFVPHTFRLSNMLMTVPIPALYCAQ
jgi:hypothetical protein